MDTGARFQIQKKIKYALKVIATIFTVVVILLVSLFLFLRSSWGQSIIVNKVTNYVSSKTGSRVAVDRLFFTFSGNLYLEGLYLEDQNQDTLLYSEKIETGVRPIPLIRGEGLQVSKFRWQGLVARINRDHQSGKFNFDFIVEALTKPEPSAVNTLPIDDGPDKTPSFPISLGPIHLENFNVIYRDDVTGIDASVELGTFDLDIPKLDLDKSEFHIRQVAFQNSNLSYHQFKPSLPAEVVSSSQTSVSPILIIDDVDFRAIKAEYRNDPDKIRTTFDIGEFIVQNQKADLSIQKIAIDSISLNKSFILFHNYADELSKSDLAQESVPSSFSWPDWDIEIGQITLNHNQLEYKTKNEVPRRGYFNPDVILLNQLNLLAGNIFLKNKQAGLHLQQFGFVDAGGLQLKDLHFGLTASETIIQIEKLGLLTNRSELDLDFTARFSSIQELMQNPEVATLDISVQKLLADIQDAYYFNPDLAKDEMTQTLASSPFNLSLLANGSLNQLDLDFVNVTWGKETMFSATGRVDHLLAMDNLTFDFPDIALRTNKKTVALFVDDQSLGIRIPENIDLSGTASGRVDDLAASLIFNSELGQFVFSGEFQEKDQMSFNADLGVQDLLLGQLLDDPQLDTLTFHLKASGSGKGIEDLNANLSASFQKLKAYNHNYSGLSLEGQIADGSGDLKLWLEDKLLDFDLITNFDLDSVNNKVDLSLHVKGVDFHQLGLASQNLRTKFLLNTQFAGNSNNFNIRTSLKDAVILLDEQTSPYGLDITACVRDDTTSLHLTSSIVNGHITSNASPQEVAEALRIHLNRYLKYGDTLTTDVANVEMKLDFTLNEAPVLKEIFLPGLDKLDSIRLLADFNAKEHLLNAALDLPYLKYRDGEIDSLAIRAHSANERLGVTVGFQNLKSDPFSMDKTYLVGELKDTQIIFDFTSYSGDEKIAHLASQIGLRGDTFSIHIDPDELIFNREVWQMPENNQVLIADGYLYFQDFILSRNLQELTLRKDLQDPEYLTLTFKDFELENITSLLNPDDPLATGLLNGQLAAEYPIGKTGFFANLEIKALQAMDIMLGNLSLEALSQKAGNYEYDLVLKDGDIDLDLTGDYMVTEEGGLFDLDLDLNKVEMTLLADLSGDELQEGSGYLSGNIQASGTTVEPKYQGYFRFNDVSFVLAQLNSMFLLSSETVRLDNNGIYFNQFTFQDDQDHQFSIDGNILTESYTNPSFDLNINAEDFIAINSTMEDNELFFGKGIIDAQINVKGDLEVPVINARLKVKNGTDLTFIVPEAELELIEREGVVVFVNRADTNVNLSEIQRETYANFNGFDMKAVVVTDPDAEFKVIVDERSGDNLLVAGEANLSLEIDRTGRMTLSGNYELRKGHYEMSLYNIVSRRFEIAEGSRISWNGEPMDADLNISAIYSLKTGSSELMTTQLSAADQESRTQYLQELPFLVFLNVKGELLRPEISFRLDMPEDQRGALGGNVYARVMQINEQEDELNNQVFSLLVLNKFFPASGSDGASGGTSALAKRSVSQALSGQLNALSSSVLGDSGLELDFDFDSFTDYQSGTAQDRTQMNVSARKRFLDERLIIQVGSQVDIEGKPQSTDRESSLIGNISVEYYLTKNGTYRLRGFRRNQFESLIDGQLVVTGVGIIFNRELNRFMELWKRAQTENSKK